MDVSQTDHQTELREYFRVLRTRKYSIVLVAVALTGAALAFSLRQPRIYTAESRVLVQAFAGTVDNPASAPDLQTERELVGTQAIAERARKIIGTTSSAAALAAGLTVEVVPDTQILLIRYTSSVPAFAAQASNAFGQAYVDFRRRQVLQQRDAAVEDLVRKIDGVKQDLADLERELAGTTDVDKRAELLSEKADLTAQLNFLEAQHQGLVSKAALAGSGSEVVQQAVTPTRPSSPNHVRTVSLAVVIGLALGVGVAFLRERLDDTIKGRHEIERRLGAPVLATVPRVTGWRRRNQTYVVTLEEPKNPVSESFRTLRTNIQALAATNNIQSVLVTSGLAGEGKTSTAVNLAVVMAQAGRRVFLISADLRRPRLHRFLNVPNQTGLSAVLSGSVTLVEATRDPSVGPLRVVPSGPIPTNPAELLESERMYAVLDGLRNFADLVIIDSPPVLAVADASILAPQVDGTLFVVDPSIATRTTISQAKDQLQNAGARLLGVVINGFDPTASSGYPYYYYYYQPEEESLSPNGRNGRRRRGRAARLSPEEAEEKT